MKTQAIHRLFLDSTQFRPGVLVAPNGRNEIWYIDTEYPVSRRNISTGQTSDLTAEEIFNGDFKKSFRVKVYSHRKPGTQLFPLMRKEYPDILFNAAGKTDQFQLSNLRVVDVRENDTLHLEHPFLTTLKQLGKKNFTLVQAGIKRVGDNFKVPFLRHPKKENQPLSNVSQNA